ncbi:hypothetical protein CBW46_001660 [Paenibacillus xerothermodurans]|uniref:Uncharacterized protein n=1 Tax=Paenibacillus xerothermodurans TaxID=1977292 RepID=A0A2W1NDD1_PAEXE|nr:hypothetical protein CBW46_001660 [Paenibacillus xerothermodurans]
MRFLTVLGYSVMCAVLLVLFSQIQDLFKYVFSIGALYFGVHFFKRHETRGMRIAFVVTTMVLYFMFALIYAVIVAIRTGLLPADI